MVLEPEEAYPNPEIRSEASISLGPGFVYLSREVLLVEEDLEAVCGALDLLLCLVLP